MITNNNAVRKNLDGDIIDMNQASEFLGLSKGRIRYEIFHKRIPYLKFGKTLRFLKSDLNAWVLDRIQESKK